MSTRSEDRLDNRLNEAETAPFLPRANISVDEIVENRAAPATLPRAFAIPPALR